VPRYIFSNGEIAVEEGVYVPLLKRTEPPKRRSVLIVIPPAQLRPTESTSEQEKPHDQA